MNPTDPVDVRVRSPGERWSRLTQTQERVAILFACGQTRHQIALVLGCEASTVDSHRINLLKRAEVRNVVELTHLAIAAGRVTNSPAPEGEA